MAEIITVTADNLDQHGFFCKMSARKSTAWKAKRDWLMARFEEGLQLTLLGDGERGFIEFMPGPESWRAIDDAEDYVVIHCLWVVGKSRGKRYARDLIAEAESWARENGFQGVAAFVPNFRYPIERLTGASEGAETLGQDAGIGYDPDVTLDAESGPVPLNQRRMDVPPMPLKCRR